MYSSMNIIVFIISATALLNQLIMIRELNDRF